MPTLIAADGAELFYTVDDFTDPWLETETIVLLHGNAESGEAWRAWVPHLARHYKVLRVDKRGFGRSSPMPADFAWTPDTVGDDLLQVVDHLGATQFHLIAAKLGGTFALRIAAEHPDRVKSLCVIGVPASPGIVFSAALPGWIEEMKSKSVRSWAATTMSARLGTKVPPAQMEWWADMMGATALSTQLGFMQMVPSLDVAQDLERIQCPTLVITSTASPMWSVEGTGAWQKKIARSELLVLDSNSYHVAAADPDVAAPRVLAFIQSTR